MKKILVVEDEFVTAMGMSMTLEDEGYAVILASNGRDGLEKARREAPDLIITDYMMPRVDGLALITALRESGIKTPVVLATSIPERNVPGNPRPAYDAYLAKPFRDDDLLRVARELLGEGEPSR